jgi:hypothetical protein
VTRTVEQLHNVSRGVVTGVAASTAERVVAAYDGREVIDLPWPAQYLLWIQYPGGARQAGHS